MRPMTGRTPYPPCFQKTAVKPTPFALRSAADDGLVINRATRHQYFSTMQADLHDQDIIDEALNRRMARAMLARQEKSRLHIWLTVLALVAGLALWLG
jgi:hypothetical protein